MKKLKPRYTAGNHHLPLGFEVGTGGLVGRCRLSSLLHQSVGRTGSSVAMLEPEGKHKQSYILLDFELAERYHTHSQRCAVFFFYPFIITTYYY